MPRVSRAHLFARLRALSTLLSGEVAGLALCALPSKRSRSAMLGGIAADTGMFGSASEHAQRAWGTIDEPDAERIVKELDAFDGRLYGLIR